MQRSDQSSEFIFLDVLELIDKKRQRGFSFFGRKPSGFEKRLEIKFKVTVVCQTWFWFEVEPDLDILVFHL